ncbi:MAG: class IV adenylate cyclase [Thermodesulfobacteriota bacterium]
MEGIGATDCNEHLEIEVKFRVEDRRVLQARIDGMGAERLSEVFETNIRWDDGSESLKARKCLLRLRKESGGKAILTFKSPPPIEEDRFKVFNERETEVIDGEEMAAILEALGFRPVQIYEKERITWRFGAVLLCLDRLPFGDFLEIEGEKQAIQQTAERLGLDWEQRILDNYLTLFEKVRLSRGLTFTDATFANFEAIRMGEPACCQAGGI